MGIDRYIDRTPKRIIHSGIPPRVIIFWSFSFWGNQERLQVHKYKIESAQTIVSNVNCFESYLLQKTYNLNELNMYMYILQYAGKLFFKYVGFLSYTRLFINI